jgi:hypothetical protein
VIIGIGIGLIVLAAALFAAAMIYRGTAGKKIKEELKREYE